MNGQRVTGQVEKLPFRKKIIYSLGQLGWSLGSFAVMNLLYYFYDSNTVEGGERMFPVFIVSAAVLGVIAALSRVFDGITDPLIAGLSDRSNSRFGRRRTFMAIGALPFALLSVLIFIPVSASAVVNTVNLMIFTFLFYLFMTMYVTPYFALMSELGHTPDERLQLSTMISITWALGFMLGNGTYLLQGMLEAAGLEPLTAFQAVIGFFAVISLVLMYLPVFFINEKRYCEEHSSSEGSFTAVVSAFRNKNFLIFTLSDLTYFLALTFIQTGISFYIMGLLDLPKETATTLMTLLFILSFIFYVPVSLLAKKIGKKKLLIVAFIIFILNFLILSFWGRLPFPVGVQAGIVTAFASLPMAVFGILPNAIVADIAEADGRQTGNFKAAVFFGARTFMSKMGASITLLIFPFISHIGGENGGAPTEFGIRTTAIASMIFLIVGLLLFLRYNEKAVIKVLADNPADTE
ncbi:MAG: MFS transporter [Spirochaetales bacterium]|uniref:MFS transporter n=1 Tax=Candidatus Thalassospirochaeta sargassi TaxID=3119039 RepID=A0AAJ1MHK1_9SPIO|nr:MFS transporter [Spirochaetales bacterium]